MCHHSTDIVWGGLKPLKTMLNSGDSMILWIVEILFYSKLISHFSPKSPFLSTVIKVYNCKQRGGDPLLYLVRNSDTTLYITKNGHELDLQGLRKQLCWIFELHKLLGVHHWKMNGKKSQVSPYYPQSSRNGSRRNRNLMGMVGRQRRRERYLNRDFFPRWT